MLILEPVIHETIWGGYKLSDCVQGASHKIGHLYSVIGQADMSNTILNGKFAGKTLCEVFNQEKKLWNMSQYDEFPLTIALVDASQNLSIQVHPTDYMADILENKPIGKTESWVFLQSPQTGWIYAGCECNTADEIKNAVNNNKMEQITSHLNVYENSCITIEGGTLHAMTAGSLVYEIEYGSNFTYRFYDYNRKDVNGNTRQLHIDKAIQSIIPQNRVHHIKLTPNNWITNDSYEICQIKNVNSYKNKSDKLECFTIIDGYGNIKKHDIRNSMSILLLPNEIIDLKQINYAMVARLK